MARYLIRASYTAEGVRGLMRDGGSSRRDAVREMVEALGGKLHSFDFALGETDVYAVVELPDNATAAAVSMVINASGAVATNSVPLLTAEEVDAATGKGVSYRPPGG